MNLSGIKVNCFTFRATMSCHWGVTFKDIVQKAAAKQPAVYSCAPHCASHTGPGVYGEVTQSIDPRVRGAREQWNLTDHLATPRQFQDSFKASLQFMP